MDDHRHLTKKPHQFVLTKNDIGSAWVEHTQLDELFEEHMISVAEFS